MANMLEVYISGKPVYIREADINSVIKSLRTARHALGIDPTPVDSPDEAVYRLDGSNPVTIGSTPDGEFVITPALGPAVVLDPRQEAAAFHVLKERKKIRDKATAAH
jgi:hypothetical protein